MTKPFSFTDADNLEANRRGELTRQQREWLRVSNPAFYWRAYGMVAAFVLVMGLSFVPMIGGLPMEAWLSVGFSALIIGTFAVVPLVRSFRQHRQLNEDLADGKVEVGEGQVTWRKNGYGAVIDGRPLKTQIGFTLEPGDYTLYYLPTTRLLVAAQRHALQTAEAPTLQGVLAKVHRCEVEALEANQRGELGEGQRRYITFVCAANFFAAAVALGLAGLIAYNVASNTANNDAFGGYVLLAIPVILAGFFGLRGFRLARDLMSGTVRMTKGKGSKSATTGRNPSFYYHVGNEKISVSATAYLAFVEGLPYRIFFLPFSKRIVNVEVGKG